MRRQNIVAGGFSRVKQIAGGFALMDSHNQTDSGDA
jgi:hypothetical protein